VLSLGLSSADLKLFELSLVTGYNLRVVVSVLDLDHRYVTSLTDQLVDGQVNLAFREKVTSALTLTLLDPDSAIGFDTQSPSDGALFADRMIRVVYSVWSDLLPRWVDVPIFCGPVTGVSRDDAILSVECQGKETLYQEPSMAWTAKTYYKGTRLVTAIRDILGSKGGEAKFDLPEWSTTLTRDFSLKPDTPLWDMVQWIVGSQLARQLFYDGRGVLRLRNVPAVAGFTFSEAHLTSVPKLSYDLSTVRNAVTVKGATPEGKPQIRAHRYLPPGDPASAVSLSRNGVKRQLMEIVDDSTINTQAAADARANEVLAAVRVGNVAFDFDSVPIPHLEPGDSFQLSTRDVSLQLRVTQFSIPLKAGSAQSNGTHRRISSNRARIRRR
jgi:hypothetical protein